MNEKASVFDTLNIIDVSSRVKKKGKFSYLSWAWAWTEVKKIYPSTTSKVYETESGRIYWDDGKTAWVKVGVTIEDLEHIEYFPIMDFKNASMPIGKITSADVNTSIQRGTTKAIGRHGLGFYIYAGEDLPEAPPVEQTMLDVIKNKIATITDQTKLKAVLADEGIGKDNPISELGESEKLELLGVLNREFK